MAMRTANAENATRAWPIIEPRGLMTGYPAPGLGGGRGDGGPLAGPGGGAAGPLGGLGEGADGRLGGPGVVGGAGGGGLWVGGGGGVGGLTVGWWARVGGLAVGWFLGARGAGEGEPHGDCRAVAFLRLKAQLAAVAGDDRLDDGKAETGTGNGPLRRVRGTEEAGEKILLVRLRDPDAGIGHRHDGPSPGRVRGQLDAAALRGEFHRVGQEVHQHPGELVGVPRS